ncbi:MAG: RNA polymerase sigma factor [Anaerolineae bacterium]
MITPTRVITSGRLSSRLEEPMTPSDETLARRHLLFALSLSGGGTEGGDPDAFAQLVNCYAGSIFNLLYRYTGDRAEAEQLAQETFLRVYRALPDADLSRPLRPWIYRIAVNLTRDWARKRRPLPFSDLGDEEGTWAEGLPDEAPAPEEVVVHAEDLARLEAAVMALPPRYSTPCAPGCAGPKCACARCWPSETFRSAPRVTR